MITLLAFIGVFILGGEPVRFDESFTPQFTDSQVLNSSKATRAGLAAWAKTDQGRMLIKRFSASDYRIVVSEDDSERGVGRAPQPGIAILLAADNHKKLKTYELILNPDYFRVPKDAVPVRLGEPTSAAEAMSLAWAGEMLHIFYYSQGISLPHHQRTDFQQQWHDVATALGFPTLKHTDDEEAPRDAIFWR